MRKVFRVGDVGKMVHHRRKNDLHKTRLRVVWSRLKRSCRCRAPNRAGPPRSRPRSPPDGGASPAQGPSLWTAASESATATTDMERECYKT